MMEQTASPPLAPTTDAPATGHAAIACVLLVYLAVLLLYTPRLVLPMITADDFTYIQESWTWQATLDHLWLPFNEHAMPLGRLSTWALVRLAGRPTLFPLTLAFQSILAVMAAVGMLYLFVRRELGHPFYGLVAMILFGVSTVYAEAVTWFSCSFGLLAVDTLLLSLLAAQRWRQAGWWHALILSAVWAALAPAWSAVGILAGPLCCLYLLLGRKPQTATPAVCLSPRLLVSLSFVPLLGSGAFLAVSLPLTADRIMHLEHYSGQTALEAFQPLTGLWYTARSLVDNLIVGFAGIPWVVLPPAAVIVVLVLVAGLAAWWWRQAPVRRLLVVGLAFILASYVLTYSARASWSYERLLHAWSRYHALPQLGLALFVCGGLPRWHARWHIGPAAGLSTRQMKALGLLTGVLLLVNFPRGMADTPAYNPEQMNLLRRIEAVDARCRAHHISADTARAALPRLPVPDWDNEHNGWVFLRGSNDPRPVSPAEARRLLQP